MSIFCMFIHCSPFIDFFWLHEYVLVSYFNFSIIFALYLFLFC